MEFEFAFYSLTLIVGIAVGYGLSMLAHWIKTRGGGW
jgi:hypothetical protein